GDAQTQRIGRAALTRSVGIPPGHHGRFVGTVDAIDMSSVRLDRFTAAVDLPKTRRGLASRAQTIKTPSPLLLTEGLAQRLAAGFRHVAEFCGANDDPF